MSTGENAGTWGTKTNTNLQIIEQMFRWLHVEQSIAGGVQTNNNYLYQMDRQVLQLAHRVIKLTGTITGNQIVTIPLDVRKIICFS